MARVSARLSKSIITEITARQIPLPILRPKAGAADELVA